MGKNTKKLCNTDNRTIHNVLWRSIIRNIRPGNNTHILHTKRIKICSTPLIRNNNNNIQLPVNTDTGHYTKIRISKKTMDAVSGNNNIRILHRLRTIHIRANKTNKLHITMDTMHNKLLHNSIGSIHGSKVKCNSTAGRRRITSCKTCNTHRIRKTQNSI